MLTRWNLNEIYGGFESPNFQADMERLKKSVEKLNELSRGLSDFTGVTALIEELERYETISGLAGAYSELSFSIDTNCSDAVTYINKLNFMNAEISGARVRLAAFLANYRCERESGEYAYFTKRMAAQYSHMLSEEEETLAAKMSVTGSGAWSILHDKLVSTLTCEYADPAENGAVRTININDCRNLAYDGDARVRKAAYEAELNAYPKIAEVSAAAINGIKGEVGLISKLRGYEHPIDQTLFNSAVSREAFDAMFTAIDDNIQFFRDYLNLKAAYLAKKTGVTYNGLPFYDLFAPVGAAPDRNITFDEAVAFVRDNFQTFSPKMAEMATRAAELGWIDVYPGEGKVSGAFCSHIYALKEFRILLNFGGSVSDAVTLAHELGHGYHSMNIMGERVLNTNYPMPLAETASTFFENILNNAVLASLGGDEKLRILENSLQDSTQVIVDIYSRYLFEKNMFETRFSHPLPVGELNELMLNAQREAYGDGLNREFLHPYMWVIKPHYYFANQNFYNWPYAFGHLLANGLYMIYEAEPSSFAEKYDAFLRNTGKMSVKNACASIGADVEDKAFWTRAISAVRVKIDEFARLVK